MKILFFVFVVIMAGSISRADEPARFRRFREAPFIQCADNGGLRIQHIHIPQVLDDSAGVITIGRGLWSFTRASRAENKDDSVVWKLWISDEDFPGTGEFAIVKFQKTPDGVSVKVKGDRETLQFKNCKLAD